MENKSKKRSGSFVNCVAIDRNDNNRQSILPHIHENRLELFYVCSGNGQYMVDNRYYPIGKGDIVICNQGVLHGEEPEQVRQIRSYSVALTGVQVEGLPPNCLIAAGSIRWCPADSLLRRWEKLCGCCICSVRIRTIWVRYAAVWQRRCSI